MIQISELKPGMAFCARGSDVSYLVISTGQTVNVLCTYKELNGTMVSRVENWDDFGRSIFVFKNEIFFSLHTTC